MVSQVHLIAIVPQRQLMLVQFARQTIVILEHSHRCFIVEGHLAIWCGLVLQPPRIRCEELTLTVGDPHGRDLNPSFNDLEPIAYTAVPTELSLHLISLLYSSFGCSSDVPALPLLGSRAVFRRVQSMPAREVERSFSESSSEPISKKPRLSGMYRHWF